MGIDHYEDILHLATDLTKELNQGQVLVDLLATAAKELHNAEKPTEQKLAGQQVELKENAYSPS